MTSSKCDAVFAQVVAKTSEVLKANGYKTTKNRARKCLDNSCGIIEFQRSREGAAGIIKFTINIGIVYDALRELGEPEILKAGVDSAHICVRIGFLMPEHGDKWWVIVAGDENNGLEREVAESVQQFAIPYVNRFVGNMQSCIALWESGESPGITDGRREWLLQKAKRALASSKTK